MVFKEFKIVQFSRYALTGKLRKSNWWLMGIAELPN